MEATTQWEGGAIGRQTESDESSGVSIPFELCHSFRFVVAAATPLNMSVGVGDGAQSADAFIHEGFLEPIYV